MTEWIRWAAVAGLALYFLFDFLDHRRVADEREELIRLKSLEFAHKASMLALTSLALVLLFQPSFPAQYVILALIATALYGEIAAKLYFRRTL